MEMPNAKTLDYARQLQKDGGLCLSRGDCNSAQHLYSQAHQIILATVGPLHHLVAENLLNMGTVNCALGDNLQARKQFGDALTIAINTDPIDSPFCITINISLANTYIAEDKLVAAESIYTAFLENLSSQTKPNSPAVVAIRTELAHLYAKDERINTALKEIDCIRKNYDHMIEGLSTSSRCEQSASIEHARLAYFYALSLTLRYFKESAKATQAMLLYTFRRKTLQMEFELTRQQVLNQSAKDSRSTLLEELDRVRQSLAKSTTAITRNSEHIDIHYRKLQNDESQRQELEETLARMASQPSVINRLDSLKLLDLAEALSEEETLIEFVKYRYYAFSGLPDEDTGGWREYRFLAFVLKADPLIRVQLVDLGNTADIDRMVNAFRAETSKKFSFPRRGLVADDEAPSENVHHSGIALRQRVFDPLVRYFAKGSKLILVLDGALWTIPFGTLPCDERNSYLTDRYNISYLNSGRELIKPQTVTKKPPSKPLVIADPKCNKRTRKWSIDIILKSPTVGWSKLLYFFTNLKKPSVLKTNVEKSGSIAAINYVPLEIIPGAGTEAEIVANLLGVPVHRKLKTKKTLFQKDTSPRIIHIATHGWFFPHEEKPRSELDSCEKPLSRYIPVNNPMLRSAILLADKQFHPTNPISAEQVLDLDLQSTELVVLSACDSGLGDIKTGEGVFGLRRAFMLVGAKAVIMSLWKVADLPTTLLMAQFYRNFTRKRQCIDDSLLNAQKYLRKTSASELFANSRTAEIIETICTKDPSIRKTVDWYDQQPQSFRPFEDPFYWGGFVFVGKNTSLSSGHR